MSGARAWLFRAITATTTTTLTPFAPCWPLAPSGRPYPWTMSLAFGHAAVGVLLVVVCRSPCCAWWRPRFTALLHREWEWLAGRGRELRSLLLVHRVHLQGLAFAFQRARRPVKDHQANRALRQSMYTLCPRTPRPIRGEYPWRCVPCVVGRGVFTLQIFRAGCR